MLSLPKTLILGATGFVGRHLLAAYRRVDPGTFGTTRRQTANRDGLTFLDVATPDLGPLRLRERGC